MIAPASVLKPSDPVGPALPSAVIQLRKELSLRTKRPSLDFVACQASRQAPFDQ